MKSDAYQVLTGSSPEALRQVPDESAQCCLTSPPYWGLRDYGVAGQLGLEKTPGDYVEKLVDVFREVRRILKPDGTLWLNLGDSYCGAGKGGSGATSTLTNPHRHDECGYPDARTKIGPGLKYKDLAGIPWRVAFALQADGWWLRCDIIWAKPSPMPESVGDRPTRAHEYLFLLAKSEVYFYDADAIREPAGQTTAGNRARVKAATRGAPAGPRSDRDAGFPWSGDTRNKRSVWTITPKPFKEAHFAVMPMDLAAPCVAAGSRPGDLVLDPFSGAGTTGVVAVSTGRRYLGVELNPAYVEMSERRLFAASRQTVLRFPEVG